MELTFENSTCQTQKKTENKHQIKINMKFRLPNAKEDETIKKYEQNICRKSKFTNKSPAKRKKRQFFL